MDGTRRSEIKIGSRVAIVLKGDQYTGNLTYGVVREILTNSPTHPHGIKVRLESGKVGRVKQINPPSLAPTDEPAKSTGPRRSIQRLPSNRGIDDGQVLQKMPTPRDQGDILAQWYCDSYFDLILWTRRTGEIVGFQLCYEKEWGERALSWSFDRGFSHKKVDEGENLKNMTPLLVNDGFFDRDGIVTLFERHSRDIEPEIARFVLDRLREYPVGEG